MPENPICPYCISHPGWATDDQSARHGTNDVCRHCLGSGVDQHTSPVPTGFWPQIDHQLLRIMEQGANTFDHVRAVLLDPVYDSIVADINLNGTRHFDDDTAFFAGSGGEKTLADALRYAGWYGVAWRTPSCYVMRHDHAGDVLTVTEGDVQRGDLITRRTS